LIVKRNFGVKPPPYRNVHTPGGGGGWFVLYAVIVLVILFLASRESRGDDVDPYACFGAGRYDAMAAGKECPKTPRVTYTCEFIRAFVAEHGEEAARAKAAELHLPKWIVRKAERCVL
jgi:hypothetical protein